MVKLGDWGLARTWSDSSQRLTDHVVTLWYRAPELLMGQGSYTSAIDLWSMGWVFETPNHEIRYSKIHERLAGGTSRQAEEGETGLVRRSKLMCFFCVCILCSLVLSRCLIAELHTCQTLFQARDELEQVSQTVPFTSPIQSLFSSAVRRIFPPPIQSPSSSSVWPPFPPPLLPWSSAACL